MDPSAIEGSMIEVILRQAGASEVTKIAGFQYYIIFKLRDDYSLAYAYNVNVNNEYFLQRVHPYPISHGSFANEQELVDFIKTDVAKFRQAIRSSNFAKFVEVTQKIQELTEKMERLFLNYNVDGDKLLNIDQGFDRIRDGIQQIAKESEKLENEEI